MKTLNRGEVHWLCKLIADTEKFIRERLDDGTTGPSGFSLEGLALRQRLFRRAVSDANSLFEGLRKTLKEWKDSISRGETQYDPEVGEGLKESVIAWISLGAFLGDKAAAYLQKGVILAKPGFVNPLRGRVQDAERILETWSVPVVPNREAAQEAESLMQGMARGVKLERSEELRALAKAAIQKGNADKASVEEWAEGLANDFTAAVD